MAVAAYCTAEDLELGDDLVATIEETVITDEIAKASSFADSYLATPFTLPLNPEKDVDGNPIWPPVLVEAVAAIATYRVMKRRGFSPESGDNEEIRNGFNDAKAWLKDVSTNKARLVVRDSGVGAASASTEAGPTVGSSLIVAPGGSGYAYDRDEDFWHDGASAVDGSNRRRGY